MNAVFWNDHSLHRAIALGNGRFRGPPLLAAVASGLPLGHADVELYYQTKRRILRAKGFLPGNGARRELTILLLPL